MSLSNNDNTTDIPFKATRIDQIRKPRIEPEPVPELKKSISRDDLIDALKKFRLEKSIAEGEPEFIVLNNLVLIDIADKRPQTLEALKEIKGLGEYKAAQYGAEILAITRESHP